jgi:hypothetical protein
MDDLEQAVAYSNAVQREQLSSTPLLTSVSMYTEGMSAANEIALADQLQPSRN